MENLLNTNNIGRPFRAYIYNALCEGKIQIEGRRVYLCQNIMEGKNCDNRLGYTYSWSVRSGSEHDLSENGVYDFKLLDEEPERDRSPEEKAKEIYKTFSFVEVPNYTSKHEIKEASMISVGFIEQALINYGKDNMEPQNMDRELNYWNEVKLEIGKL